MTTEREHAEFLQEQHRALDAGELPAHRRAYLDEKIPNWSTPEVRWTVGTDRPPLDASGVEMAAWYVGMHRRLDDGRMADWTRSRLDETAPGWDDDETREICKRLAVES